MNTRLTQGAVIAAMLASTVNAHATSWKEWQLGATADVGVTRSEGASATGGGTSLQIRHGLRHWLQWEAVALSWHHAQRFTNAAHVRYDLHRFQALSTIMVQPPVSVQLRLHWVVPFFGVGAGIRGDLQINRESLSPRGHHVASLDRSMMYDICITSILGVDFRFTDGFSLLLSARTVGGMRYPMDLDLYLGFFFGYSIYGG